MAFLFKSKKNQHRDGLSQSKDQPPSGPTTPASSIAHSGAPGSTPREREKDIGLVQRATPSTSINDSVHSFGSASNPSPENKVLREKTEPENKVLRDKAEADSQPPRPALASLPSAHGSNASLYPWSQRRFNFTTSHPSPFPRYGAAVNAVASKEGDIYIMGGLVNGSTVKGDLWMVEAEGGNMSCYPVPTTAEGPGPRVGHASLIVGNAFIVFGGDTKIDERDVLDDTLYLLNTSTRQWSRALPPGTRPSGRYGHTLNIIGSKLYVFGGQVEGFFFNDLVSFDLNALQTSTNQWEMLIANSTDGGPPAGQIPPARTNHTIVNWGDRLYLFGGTNGSQWFNDVWTYDPRTNKWSQLECIGFIPAPREGHAAALVGDVMYIFGGRTEEGNDLGDLAAFRISLRRWYTFQNMGPSPSPRSGHSMTAHEKQIVVVGGEPSSAPRDAAELSLVYILDTAKIRYPTDHPSPGSAPDRPPGNRRPSETTRNGIPQGRPFPSREGSGSLMDGREIRRGMGTPRESMLEHSGHYSRPGHPTPINGPVSGAAGGSRLPRASVSQAPSGPPPQQQAPPPRINGVLPSPPAPRSKTPTRVERAFSPAGDAQRAGSMDKYNVSNVIRESPTATEPSHANGRRTPTQQQQTPSGARPKGPEETVSSESLGRSRSQSMRQQIPAESIKEPSSTDTAPTSQPPHSQNSSQHDIPYRRSPSEDRGSHRLQQQNEALTKELEAIKNRNAWYASELALARRAGYASNSSSSPVLDKATDTFGDKEKPLLEAFLAMRSELANVQGAIEAQSALAAEKIAEVENQRDVAVSEAVYAKAKLAAHGGSQASTPQLDSSSRDGADRDVDRSVEINRRLASSLASQTELRTKLERLEAEIQGEKQARQLAENIANVAQSRIEELDSYKQRNASEVEGLRAELHEVQKLARDEAVRGAEAVATSQLSEVDKVDLQRRLEEALDISKAHSSTLSSMRDAVAASSDKVILLEKKLEDERTHRETLERKLRQLRAEHEERTEELEGMTRRLRDAEELAEAHATEARKHRDAMLSGLGKAANRDLGALGNPAVDERIKILQSQVESSTVLVRKSQAAADSASEKLRSAEERIAGLEAYQEQASREGLTLRKNLQSAIKQTQSLQAENAELSAQLANQQLEANAIAVQHGALKDLLGERGINVSELRRSQSLSRQGSGSGTPDQARLRELELQLEASVKAHTALQTSFETREQEADRAYREKLEQLENDYQSAVHYVKGTEKMLKRMKDELSKYKTHNTRLQTELEEVQQAKASAQTEQESPPSWQAERQALRDEIEGLQKGVNNSIAQLEKQMSEVRAELQATQRERDEFKDNSQHVEREIAILADQARADLEQLKRENTLLETRAQDAEQKVSLLLDQVESSVDNYRRQSRHGLDPTGANVIQRQPGGQAQGSHHRNDSALSNISEVSSTAGPSGFGPDNRNSLALDHLASELETLRSHWESTNKNYRLSNTFDFEKTPTSVEGGEISHSLANWRKRLDLEEQEAELQHEDGPRDAGRDDGHESSPRGVGGEAENNGSGQTTPRRQGSMPGMVQAGLRMDDESEDEAENSDEEAEDDKDAHGDVGDSKVTELAQRHHAGADIPGQSTSSSSSSLTAAAAASAARAAGVAGG